MQRGFTVLACALLMAAPAAAQWHDMPVWNNPKGGSGIGIYADYSSGNQDAGEPTAYGVRGSVGFGNLTVTLGYSSSDLDLSDNYNSFGGNVAFRVIGGSLMPVAVNLQGGLARIGEANLDPATTRLTLGGGVSVSLPLPLSIEPYLSLTNRWYSAEGFDTESNLGWTLGANASFGMFGGHLAYDSEDFGSGTSGLFGIGVHVSLKMPGM